MIKAIAVAAALVATPVLTAAAEAPASAIALIEVKKPWYAPDFLVASRMKESLPIYRAAKGLQEKDFIISDRGTFGGVYRWADRASGDAFYDSAWRARIIKQYGAPAEMTWFTSPLAIDGPDAAKPFADGAVVAIVRTRIPAGTPRETILAGFQASVPTYQAVPGLRRKWYIITEDDRIGGVYLWSSRAAADAFYSASWRARIERTYGAPADLMIYKAPVVLRN